MRRDLKGYAIIVLRKAVFSREEATRQIAVSGFLQLLEQLAEGKMSRIRHAARRAEVARYALYGGLTEAEISIMLDIPKSTIGRDIRFVRAWLMTRLEEGQGDG